MKMPATSRVLQIACVCALVALALICWSLFDPRPVPVILAMSLGQIIGTMSFVAFLYVVALDVRKPKTPTPSVGGDAGDHRVE
jgi:hypothetical protein